MIDKFLKFATVGMIGTAAHYAILIALVQGFLFNAVISSSAGAIAGAMINYFINYKWTFNSSQQHSVAASKFMVVAAAGFVINGLLMTLFVELLNVHYLIAQILTTGLVLFWNFLGNYFWTFKKHGA